jgi:hypothetical protein
VALPQCYTVKMPTSRVPCCSVYIESIVQTPAGLKPFGFATGFLYAGPHGTRWLVTNWHVVTGRRPDDPGMLLRGKPTSPISLRFSVEDPGGTDRQHVELALYDADGPTWIECDREQGVDLALIQLKDAPRFRLPLSQSFAPNSSMTLEPGLEVVMVGHPFELGTHAASAIWKGAMVASGRDSAEGRPWILVDAPGVPGMSGAPVYYRTIASARIGGEHHRSGQHGAGQAKDRVKLELVGVYAGAAGEKALEELRLGRVFPIHLVEETLRRRERGFNPFQPTF